MGRRRNKRRSTDIDMARPALWRRCVVKVCSAIVLLIGAAVVGAAIWLRLRNQGHPPPLYYAAITHAAVDLGRPDGAVFDLSLGVAAPPGRQLTGGGYCLERGTAVQVSYRGTLLASEAVAGGDAVCASWWLPPGNTGWTRLVAVGTNMTTLPVSVADALAADARSGAWELDVSIWMADGKTTAWCRARRVGDHGKAARPCDVRNSSTGSE